MAATHREWFFLTFPARLSRLCCSKHVIQLQFICFQLCIDTSFRLTFSVEAALMRYGDFFLMIFLHPSLESIASQFDEQSEFTRLNFKRT
jgi:hypothetical protein